MIYQTKPCGFTFKHILAEVLMIPRFGSTHVSPYFTFPHLFILPFFPDGSSSRVSLGSSRFSFCIHRFRLQRSTVLSSSGRAHFLHSATLIATKRNVVSGIPLELPRGAEFPTRLEQSPRDFPTASRRSDLLHFNVYIAHVACTIPLVIPMRYAMRT